MYYLDDGLSQQIEYIDLIDEIKDTFEDEMDTDLCNAVLNYFHDQMNDEEFVYYLKNYLGFYLNDTNELTFNESRDEIFIRAENLFNTAFMFFDFLNCSYLSIEERQKESLNVIYAIAGFLNRIPQEKYTIAFDEAASTLIRKALPFISTIEDKEGLLRDILVKKQPANYMHSLMVERISLSILDYINNSKDLLLNEFYKIGFSNYDELKSYVARAARIHDLGKSLSTGLITQQYRSLTDLEYKYVKKHPEKGLALIGNDKDFAPYFDVMIGHHKDYDGKNGYPVYFDNTKSKYKIIIDLIRIADAIDAGTDCYGRNYSLGKNFDMLFQELVDGEGTKYNPFIVEFIRNHSNLMNELRYYTIDGRYEQIYNTYFK
jgi:HD-GYP domain-containing protein (c-di-GMP phosphodiesterase class II)